MNTQVFNRRGQEDGTQTIQAPHASVHSSHLPSPTTASSQPVEYIDQEVPEKMIRSHPIGLSQMQNLNSWTVMAIWSFGLAFFLTPMIAGLFVKALSSKDYSFYYWVVQLLSMLCCIGAKSFDSKDFKSLSVTSVCAYLLSILNM